MKLKIEQDLFAYIKDSDEFSNVNIRKALGFYTSRLAYQESILAHTHRVDLEGNALEELDQSHKDHAMEQVALLKTKIKGHQDRDDAL